MRRSELNGFRRETLEEFFWRSSNLVMMVLDDAGRVLACNEGFYHLFSVREEAAGRPIQSLLLPESRGVFDKLLDGGLRRARLSFAIHGAPSHSLECHLFVEGGRVLLIGSSTSREGSSRESRITAHSNIRTAPSAISPR